MAVRHVRRFVGELVEQNFERVREAVFEEIDYVIGLDVLVDPHEFGADAKGEVTVSQDEQQVIFSQYDPNEGGFEILINGGISNQWAIWHINGFYTVKSGGMAQGIVSVGLLPADEAAIRLNPAVKVIDLLLRD